MRAASRTAASSRRGDRRRVRSQAGTSRAAPASSTNSVAACSRRISSLTSSRASGRRIEKVWTVKPRPRNCATSPRMNESLARA